MRHVILGADVLAGRKTTGTIQGKVTFGGQVPTRGFLRKHTGYVEQDGAPPTACCLACITTLCALHIRQTRAS